jgi:glycosyltransferase involved in cell wall biosynthesis
MSSRGISIVMPAFNEEKALPITLAAVQSQLGGEHEIIVVDDGSTDGTWRVITALAQTDPRIRGVRFSRNFGKEAAIAAGLELARGDAAIVMDCDLQHPPELLPEMIRIWQRGDVDVVEAFKQKRGGESLISRMMARSFYAVFERLSGIDLVGASDFKLLDRRVINTYNQFRERNAFFRGLTAWLGFRREAVHFEVPSNESRPSRWTRTKLASLAVNAILAFSPIPLFVVLGLAAVFFIVSVVLGVWALYLWAIGRAVSGFTTVILLILMSGSMILAGLGVIGLYLSRIYDEVRGRPRAIMSESTWQAKPGSRIVEAAEIEETR